MPRLSTAAILSLLTGIATATLAAEGLPNRRMRELVITPGRLEQRRVDVPENVTVLTRDDVHGSAALVADDLLRQVPGFSLFRRSSSVVAHPTVQGVSLRGIGPSGASRTLVLLDGIPLNDPFGGWVYWNRVPLEDVDRIEVVRGGGSGLWGSAALGGVIHVVTARPAERRLRFTGEGGNRETYRLDGGASGVRGPFGVSLGGGVFDTAGYPVIRHDQRGPIDGDASSRHASFRGRAEYRTDAAGEWGLDGGTYVEDRGNGTPLTENETRAGIIRGSARVSDAGGSEWRLASFAQLQSFESTFSTQAPDRSSESPALDQFDVPSESVGAAAQWIGAAGGAQRLTAGSDFRWIHGETNEDFRFLEGRFTRRRRAGGTQALVGVYAEDVWTLTPSLDLTLAGRADFWRNGELFRRERSLTDGSALVDDSADTRDRFAFSPKLGLVGRLGERGRFRGAFYRGFRAPTLNELVRPFRVRNDITEANPSLDPERLLGGELGGEHGTAALRGTLTGFWNEIDDPIANVTIASGPGDVPPCGFVPEGGVCRQRRNLDRSRVRGLEAAIEWAPRDPWLGSLSYLLSDAKITDSPQAPELEGKRLAQVPTHTVVAKIGYAAPRLIAANLQVRYVGEQFEDDQNTLSLGSFVVVDLFIGRELRDGLDVFVAVENLFDRTYAVGKTADGLVSVGAPTLVHGGIRIRL